MKEEKVILFTTIIKEDDVLNLSVFLKEECAEIFKDKSDNWVYDYTFERLCKRNHEPLYLDTFKDELSFLFNKYSILLFVKSPFSLWNNGSIEYKIAYNIDDVFNYDIFYTDVEVFVQYNKLYINFYLSNGWIDTFEIRGCKKPEVDYYIVYSEELTQNIVKRHSRQLGKEIKNILKFNYKKANIIRY